MLVRIKKLNENAVIPSYGSEFAAGCDLYACLDNPIIVNPHQTVKSDKTSCNPPGFPLFFPP